MMSKIKLALLALVAAGTGALGAGAWAHGGHGFGQHGRAFGQRAAMMHRFMAFALDEKLSAIGATEAQKQKAHALAERLMTQGQALHGDRGALHAELLEQFAKDQPDEARVRALVQGRVEAIARLADDATSAVFELHALLTPEQRRALLADARAHMESHAR
jgi:Spy/CpxP family protein refolding chaperone